MKRSKWINGGEAPAYVVVVYDFRSFYIGAEREHVLESNYIATKIRRGSGRSIQVFWGSNDF